MASDTTHSRCQRRGLPASPACPHATHRRLAVINLALRGSEADRGVPNAELRMTSRVSRTSTFELQPSNFAPALPGQAFYSTQDSGCLWLLANDNAVDFENNACLFVGETELSSAT